MSDFPTPLRVHTRASFVRKTVETIPITDFVIDAIMPYFPLSTKVIGGYVDTSDQFWKVNFHWEYLLRYLDKARDSNMKPNHKAAVKAIRTVLTKSSPTPNSGYTSSKEMGLPKDASSRDKITARWRVVRQSKRDFKQVLRSSKALDGLKKKEKKRWLLAVAPVAKPGRSKHSAGYALDLYGDNKGIGSISKALGASLVFPEGSHVHVEFKNGVAGKKWAGAAAPNAPPIDSAVALNYDFEQNVCVISPGELAELKNSTRNPQAASDFSDDIPYLEVLSGILDDVLGEDWW